MEQDREQVVKDDWQTALYEAAYRFSVSVKELHETNPWPENGALHQVIDLLATELWDRCFGLTEITSALSDAAEGLPRYAAGEEFGP
jgi:hypothetical protein